MPWDLFLDTYTGKQDNNTKEKKHYFFQCENFESDLFSESVGLFARLNHPRYIYLSVQ